MQSWKIAHLNDYSIRVDEIFKGFAVKRKFNSLEKWPQKRECIELEVKKTIISTSLFL